MNIAMAAKRKEATKIDGQYSDQEEKEARVEIGEQAAIVMPDSVLEAKQWAEIVRKILKTVLTAYEEVETAQKWNETCRTRMEDCVAPDKQLLQFAEKLEREKQLFLWGAGLFAKSKEVMAKKENKIEFNAWQVLLQN